jgi:hypothetical protein
MLVPRAGGLKFEVKEKRDMTNGDHKHYCPECRVLGLSRYHALRAPARMPAPIVS